MNSDSDILEHIFSRALQIEPADERQAFLDQACGSDEKLRQRVEKMLNAQPKATPFLEHPFAVIAPTIDQPIAERPGTQIGPYKLYQEIGEGGMGVVYMALQKEPVRRKVALKIIKLGMDTREVVARFAAEEQALAIMDHPNIAKVFDAGTTETGRPYFVMELVNGVPITQYCDDNNSTTEQRLELFALVCHAVQHAHQKGIIHRDIKPSNILVTLHDGVPVPKVIDFGIAKAINQELTSQTMATGVGHMIGTPLYMSPEQAERSGLDIDTRSDIYSLGVLLYELLTGSTPFDRDQFKDAGLDEVRRLIREQEPPRPSTRISTMGKAATTASERRRTSPAELSNSLRHELDWIVMKALEKDRTRRYESANDFARDIQRYLHDEPVEACPPSTAYRLKKFVRRNRTAVLSTAAIGLALILGAGVAAGQAYRATRAEKVAEEQLQIAQDQERLAKQQTQLAKKQKKLAEEAAQREGKLRAEAEQQRDLAQKATEQTEAARKQSEAVTQFLVDAFRSPGTAQDGRTITVLEILNRAQTRVESELAEDRLLQARLLSAIGRAYCSLALFQEATPVLQKAAGLLTDTLGPEHDDTLGCMDSLAFCYCWTQRLDEAVQLQERTVELLKAKLPPSHGKTLGNMFNLAGIYQVAGRTDEALALYKQTLELTKSNLGPDNQLTLSTMGNLATLYMEAGQWDEALPLLEHMLERQQETLGPDDPLAHGPLFNLARTYQALGRREEVVTLHQRALEMAQAKFGPEHPRTLGCMHMLAESLCSLGRWDQGIPLFEKTLEMRRAALPADDPGVLATMKCLGAAYRSTHRYEDAVNLLKATLELAKTRHGLDHPKTLSVMGDLAKSYFDAGRKDEAVALLEQKLELLTAKCGPDHPSTLTASHSLTEGYFDAGRENDAVALLEQRLGLLTAKCGPDHPNTLSARDRLTEGYFRVGRRDEAAALAAQTLQLKKSKLGEAHPSTLETMYELADHLLGTGQQEQALPLLEKTVELRKITLGPDHPDTISALDVLSNLHADRHEYAAAAALLLHVSEHRPLAAATWYRLGLMHVASGEKEAYQRSCHELLGRYLEGAEPPFPGWELAWCCKLAPIGEEDALQVERLARESYAAAPDDQRARHELACALYRAGKFAESLEHLQALWDNDVPGRVWSGVWLAMVHARMGNAPEAQRYFDLSVEASKEASWPTGSYTALEHELLRREAETLLEAAQAKPDESPAGDGNK